MFQKSLNELTLSFRIEGHSPLFIKDGRYEKQPKDHKSPDAIFISKAIPGRLHDLVTTALKGSCGEFYIPGASLKGAWRCYLEKALRSLDDDPKVCDPLAQADDNADNRKQPKTPPAMSENPYRSCSDRLMNKDRQRTGHPYRESCPVCRLFGSTALGSRVAISDCKCEKATPILAENNAISRQTGAARAPFKSLVLRDAVFTGTLRIRNFELWQIGLLARLFDDLKDSRVPLGAGKNKGWGRTCVVATTIEIAYFGTRDWVADGKLRGCAEMISAEERARYGMQATPENLLPAIVLQSSKPTSLWRSSHAVANDNDSVNRFWNATRTAFDETVWQGFHTLAKLEAACGVKGSGQELPA